MTRLESQMDNAKRLRNRVRMIMCFVGVCVLITILIYTCSRYGFRGGVIFGLLVFLFYGGAEFLWFTLSQRECVSSEKQKGTANTTITKDRRSAQTTIPKEKF